ncbi:MAG: hypothetical protein VW230_02800 [Candidatus Poseidoniales archaeon]
MAGGGTAPALKMSDVLIFSGISILLASLVMHAWEPQLGIEEDGEALSNGVSMMKDDRLLLSVEVVNESTVRISVQNEAGETIGSEIKTIAKGTSFEYSFEAEDAGFYTYKIDTRGNEADINVDIQRKWLIDFVPIPIGAILLGLGLSQRKATQEE